MTNWQRDAAEAPPTVGQTDPDEVPAERQTSIVAGDVSF
jgi:hypothetical protein